jgi:hypothetical protein
MLRMNHSSRRRPLVDRGRSCRDGGHEVAEERDVGLMRAVGHVQRAAGAGGVHQGRGRRAVCEGDVGKVERVLADQAGDGAGIVLRVIELPRAGVRGKGRIGARRSGCNLHRPSARDRDGAELPASRRGERSFSSNHNQCELFSPNAIHVWSEIKNLHFHYHILMAVTGDHGWSDWNF